MSLKDYYSAIKKEGYVVSDLDLYLLSLNDKDNDRAINVNSPSQVGGCTRAMYYSRTGTPQDSGVDARTRRIFDNGTHTHERLQEYLKKQGVLLMDEVPVHNDAYNIQGHTDGLLELSKKEGGVLEIKSINSRGFSALKDAKPEHKMQALVYLYCLEERRKYLSQFQEDFFCSPPYQEYESHYTHLKDGHKYTREEKLKFSINNCLNRDKLLFGLELPLTKCVLLYENKDTQELKEFLVESNKEEHAEIIKEFLEAFDYINECVDIGEVPERLCKNKSDQCGRWCKFKNTCFIV